MNDLQVFVQVHNDYRIQSLWTDAHTQRKEQDHRDQAPLCSQITVWCIVVSGSRLADWVIKLQGESGMKLARRLKVFDSSKRV